MGTICRVGAGISESLRIAVVGLLLYSSPGLSFTVGSRWFEELGDRGEYRKKAQVARRRLWMAMGLVTAVILATVIVHARSGQLANAPCSYWVRLFAAGVALVGTLGRGGWAIQSYGGHTVIERIDRGMWVISQIGQR